MELSDRSTDLTFFRGYGTYTIIKRQQASTQLMLYIKKTLKATEAHRMSTPLLWVINEDIMEDTLWTLKNGQDINKDCERYSRKGSWFEKKYFMHVWQDSIRISDFSGRDRVVSDFLLKVLKSTTAFSFLVPLDRSIIYLPIFQTPVIYTTLVPFKPPSKRLYRTIIRFQVPSSTPSMQTLHPRGHLTPIGRRDLGHFFTFSLSLLFTEILHIPYATCSFKHPMSNGR